MPKYELSLTNELQYDIEKKLPIYNRVHLLNSFARAYNLNWQYCIVSKKNNIVAILPLFFKKKYSLNIISAPQLYYYSQFTFLLPKRKIENENELEKIEIINAIVDYLSALFFRLSFKFSPALYDVRAFQWNQFAVQNLYTYVMPLKTVSETNYIKEQRASIRKAKTAGFQFDTTPKVNEFLALEKNARQRMKRTVSLSNKKHEMLINELLAANFIRFFNLSYEKKLISSWIMLEDEQHKIGYGWQHYSDSAFMKLGCSPYIYHKTFLHYHEKKYHFIDLCGANTKQIARIKASLGAKLTPFYRVELWNKYFRWMQK